MAAIAPPPIEIQPPPAAEPTSPQSVALEFLQADVKEYRWTCKEYQRLAEVGFQFRRRVELLGGKIYEMAPQLDLHTVSVERVRRSLERAFGPAHWIRAQFPLQVSPTSAPEPDIAVVPGDPLEYVGKGQPTSALLVVEVSDITLRSDRRRKSPRYARAGVLDSGLLT